ncbi:uncharacterized protein LOC121873219 isoform X1 [Homarus americanus]|uniref:Regulatory protein zeste n=1 Tax=Homarus americanus TaxID=6706 RepID=A0A8J5TL36_HOMAM|nr:uncharacterized protein LOC121873219 isoform X1 [Homarus americanus]KAG7176610.1 Cysteine-rich protein 2-binding protein-like 3 [Homarus americanus]
MTSFMPNMSCGPCLYCNATSQDAPEELLRCDLCRRSAHVLCLRSGTPDGVLLGDNFFNFTCSMCHQSGQDTTVRARLNIPQILLLVLYNLHKTETNTARSGFFHWKIHIYNFISHHWKEIFGPESRKKKKKVLQASLSGQLNNYGKYFISGYETLRDGGWYRLAFVLPPAQLIQRQVAEKRVVASVGNADPVRSRRRKISKDDLSKETPHIKEEPIEESVSSGDVSFDSPDDSSRGSWFTEKDVLKPHACPPQALFDSEEEDEKHVTMKEEVMVKKEEADIEFVGVKEDKRDGVGKEDEGDAEFLDVDGSESEVPQNNRVETQPSIEPRSCAQASLFTRTISTAASMLMEHSALSRELTTENVRALSGYEEQQLLHQLEELQESGPLPPDLHRLRRKLAVRSEKPNQSELYVSQSEYKHGKGAIRASPITEYEKEYLIKIVKEFQGIIDDKSTSFVAVSKKAAVWQDIAARFNAATGYSKSSQQVRKIWENIRNRARKYYMRLKEHQSQTGEELPLGLVDRLSAQVLPLIEKELEPQDNTMDPDASLHVEAILHDSDANDSSSSLINNTHITLPCPEVTPVIIERAELEGSTSKVDLSLVNHSLPEHDRTSSVKRKMVPRKGKAYDAALKFNAKRNKRRLELDQAVHDEQLKLIEIQKCYYEEHHKRQMQVLEEQRIAADRQHQRQLQVLESQKNAADLERKYWELKLKDLEKT